MPFVINAGDAPVSLWSRHARHFTIITPYSPPIKTGPREKNLLYTTDWVFGSYYWGELNVCSRKTICSLSSFTTSINCIVFLWLAVTAARKLLLVLVPCVIKNNIEVTSSKKYWLKNLMFVYKYMHMTCVTESIVCRGGSQWCCEAPTVPNSVGVWPDTHPNA